MRSRGGKASPRFEPEQAVKPNAISRVADALSEPDPAPLQRLVEGNRLDTIVVAGVDFQGRLFGKHLDAQHFVQSSPEGTYVSVAALANDIRLDLVEGWRRQLPRASCWARRWWTTSSPSPARSSGPTSEVTDWERRAYLEQI